MSSAASRMRFMRERKRAGVVPLTIEVQIDRRCGWGSVLHCKCPLMTQSGHSPFQIAGLNRYDGLCLLRGAQ